MLLSTPALPIEIPTWLTPYTIFKQDYENSAYDISIEFNDVPSNVMQVMVELLNEQVWATVGTVFIKDNVLVFDINYWVFESCINNIDNLIYTVYSLAKLHVA